jgi:hypothetical protein
MGDSISRDYVLRLLSDWQMANASYDKAEAYNLIGVFMKMIEQMPSVEPERTVEDILIQKGARCSSKGFSYLVTAVASAKGQGPEFLMMEVYKDVAAVHNDNNYKAIERAIRHCISFADKKCPPKAFIAEVIYELERAGK